MKGFTKEAILHLVALIETFIEEVLPPLEETSVRQGVCTYTMMYDAQFLIGRRPEQENGLLSVRFSGHAFKLMSAIGELMSVRSTLKG